MGTEIRIEMRKGIKSLLIDNGNDDNIAVTTACNKKSDDNEDSNFSEN